MYYLTYVEGFVPQNQVVVVQIKRKSMATASAARSILSLFHRAAHPLQVMPYALLVQEIVRAILISGLTLQL